MPTNVQAIEDEWNGLIAKTRSGGGHEVELWAEMQASMEKVDRQLKEISADPKFQATPALNVQVEGVPVSGMDPADIKDPTVRARYEEAIRLNKEAIAATNYKTDLERLLRKMIEQSKAFLESKSSVIPHVPEKLEFLASLEPKK